MAKSEMLLIFLHHTISYLNILKSKCSAKALCFMNMCAFSLNNTSSSKDTGVTYCVVIGF
jgi:hypothetical protein